MATFKTVLFAVLVLAATSSAAPQNKKLSLTIPDECKGKGFCSIKPKGYEEMEEIINRLLPADMFVQTLGDRSGEDEPELSPRDDWHNCPYIKKTESVYAYSGSNDSDTDIFIQTKLMKQTLDVITCANDHIERSTGGQTAECFKDLGLHTLGTKLTCRTATSKRKLLIFDPVNYELKHKIYEVPCCCTCDIKNAV